MTEQERLLAALEYQEAQRPALMNPNLMRQGQRMNLPARQAPGPMAEFVTQAMSLDPQPDQGLGTVGAEMGLSLVPGVGQAMGLRDVERGRRANDPVMMGLGAASLIPVGKLINALRGGKQMGPVSELDVYHGSTHKMAPTESNPLGEFDPTKIGTGEGAQAYGYGHYLAENPQVASGYKEAGKGMGWEIDGVMHSGMTTRTNANPYTYAANALDRFKGDREAAIKWLDPNLPFEGAARDIIRNAKSVKPIEGFLYKVDLPDEQIAKMLDWDKPLSQAQSDMALKAFGDVRPVKLGGGYYGVTRVGPDGSGTMIQGINRNSPEEAMAEFRGIFSGRKGEDAHRLLAGILGGPEKASAAMQQAGIPGIRYLDQGSRVGGKGTSNFVVFPGGEKMLNILERQ